MYLLFAQRVAARPAWTRVAFVARRGLLALALCAIPAAIVLAVALTHPPATEADRVRDTFARYISGLITAATIAVGFATLSLRRGIKGLGELKDHVQADRAFAERVARLTGERAPPGVGATLALLLDASADRARELGAHDLARHATRAAGGVRDARGDPDALLLAALDFDSESALHAATTEMRDERLADLLEAADIGRSYVKTLGTQWSISHMSQTIAWTSIVAVVVATLVVLAYERFVGAPFVLAAATGIVLAPLAVFVSYAFRLTFLNQHTLPIGHFVLGPENPRAAERTVTDSRPGASRRGPPDRSA